MSLCPIFILNVSFFSLLFSSLSLFLHSPPPPALSLSLQVHNEYTADDFVGDLRTVLRRTSCFDEKIVFIMDESNVIDFALERMKTLLANGEVRREGGEGGGVKRVNV